MRKTGERSRAARQPGPMRRVAMIGLICLMSGGCGQLVRDVAMLPIKAAEAMAVESAKVPFRVAKQTTDAAIDALFKGK